MERVRLFEATETNDNLNQVLREAGFDPTDAKVNAIKQIVSRYYAGRTAEVLQRVNEVLGRFVSNTDNASGGSEPSSVTPNS